MKCARCVVQVFVTSVVKTCDWMIGVTFEV